MSDPGSGKIRYNTATVSTVTEIAVDDLSANANNISNYINTWDDSTSPIKGYLVMVNSPNNTTEHVVFAITGLVDEGGWKRLAVTYVSGILFTDGLNVFLQFYSTGDIGLTGATGSNATAFPYTGTASIQGNVLINSQLLLGVGQNSISGNIALGNTASLSAITTGGNNIAIGNGSLESTTDGLSNIALGTNALKTNLTGMANVGVGVYALYGPTAGNGNTAIGSESMIYAFSGSSNVAVGYQALSNTTTNVSENVAIGYRSMFNNGSGSYSIAIGTEALSNNIGGSYNVAFGKHTLYSNTYGNNNIAIGAFSLYSNTNGYSNIAIGEEALNLNSGGVQNIAIGTLALRTSIGDYNIGIGNNVESGTHSSSILLGNGATASDSNQLVIGSSTTPIGPIVIEGLTSSATLQIRLNGVSYKILLAI